MVLTYSKLDVESIKALEELLELDFPIKESLIIFSVSKQINSKIEIKSAMENKLLNKYVEKDDSGKIKQVLDDNKNPTNEVYIRDMINYKKEIDELNSETFEIHFEKIDPMIISNIKPKILLKLEWLFNL